MVMSDRRRFLKGTAASLVAAGLAGGGAENRPNG